MPYSEWRGPIWIVSNALLVYGLCNAAYRDTPVRGVDPGLTCGKAGIMLAEAVTKLLAAGIASTGEWRECYHSETGQGLAGPNFLSWNVLSRDLYTNVTRSVPSDPFCL